MKRLFAMVLVILLAFVVSAVAFAEVDLSGMSVDELIKLKQAIELELFNLGAYKDVKVPVGTYIVGEDIPSGTYSIKAIQTVISMSEITVFEKGRDATGFDYRFDEIASEDSPIGKLSLKNGETIVVSYGGAVFTKYVGLGF